MPAYTWIHRQKYKYSYGDPKLQKSSCILLRQIKAAWLFQLLSHWDYPVYNYRFSVRCHFSIRPNSFWYGSILTFKFSRTGYSVSSHLKSLSSLLIKATASSASCMRFCNALMSVTYWNQIIGQTFEKFCSCFDRYI